MPSERSGSGCSRSRSTVSRTVAPISASARSSASSERGVLVSVGDRVEPEHRRLLAPSKSRKRTWSRCRPRRRRRVGRRSRRPPRRTAARVVPGAVAEFAEADEVRVRVEHHDPERRLGEQALEDRPERVRLTRARLAAEERMAVERAGVEGERDALGVGERAHLEHRPGWPRGVEPAGDLGGRRRAGDRTGERFGRPGKYAALDPGQPSVRRVEVDARRVAEPGVGGAVGDHDVAPHAQIEAVDRHPQQEGSSVDRRRPALVLALRRHRGSL